MLKRPLSLDVVFLNGIMGCAEFRACPRRFEGRNRMLEQIDLTQRIEKARFKETWVPLERRLGELQRDAREAGIPVVIAFEGWDAAGKGTVINRTTRGLDPRGFRVHPISAPNEREKLHPFLWRFWTATPKKGEIAVFDRSWYGRVLVGRVDGLVDEEGWRAAYEEILQFERQLADDGAVILKFWLHIDKNEQKRRFKKLEKDKALAWKVGKAEWQQNKKYDEWVEAVEEMLQRTSTAHAPWTIVESTDRRFAWIKVIETIIASIDRALALKAKEPDDAPPPSPVRRADGKTILDHVDLSLSLERPEYSQQLKAYQKRLFRLEHEIYVHRIPVVIVYEGWDAGGKGGNIRRLTRGLDPRGYEVIPVGVPTAEALAHHYLWRFWRTIPKAGHITIFDRSWYGRVLVERVERFCSTSDWMRAFREINEFEESLSNFGAVLVKFWIHISRQEQLRRFQERESTAHKQWKITDEDWRNRERWDVYEPAVIEMLQRTSTIHAPWTIVEGDCKLYARVKAIRTVVEALEGALGAASGV